MNVNKQTLSHKFFPNSLDLLEIVVAEGVIYISNECDIDFLTYDDFLKGIQNHSIKFYKSGIRFKDLSGNVSPYEYDLLINTSGFSDIDHKTVSITLNGWIPIEIAATKGRIILDSNIVSKIERFCRLPMVNPLSKPTRVVDNLELLRHMPIKFDPVFYSFEISRKHNFSEFLSRLNEAYENIKIAYPLSKLPKSNLNILRRIYDVNNRNFDECAISWKIIDSILSSSSSIKKSISQWQDCLKVFDSDRHMYLNMKNAVFMALFDNDDFRKMYYKLLKVGSSNPYNPIADMALCDNLIWMYSNDQNKYHNFMTEDIPLINYKLRSFTERISIEDDQLVQAVSPSFASQTRYCNINKIDQKKIYFRYRVESIIW